MSIPGYGGADGIRQKFTQKERDNESGLDYFLARYYSSAQGRFGSADNFAGNPAQLLTEFDRSSALPYSNLLIPQTLNPFVYVDNNPLSLVDPDGHQGGKREKWGRYTVRIDRNNANDNPNIHLFDGKKPMGKVTFEAGQPAKFKGEIEKPQYAGLRRRLEQLAESRGLTGQTRTFGSRSTPQGRGRMTGGSGVFGGLTVIQILLDILGQRSDAQKQGFYTNFLGQMVISDPSKAAATLGEGAKILVDDPSLFGQQPALFVVKDGQFVSNDPRCPGCTLVKDEKDGSVRVSGPTT